MSTRFYIAGSTSLYNVVGLSTNGDWEMEHSQVKFLQMRTSKVGVGNITISPAKTAGVVQRVLGVCAVGPMLSAQTISGTVKGQMRIQENSGDADGMTCLVVRIVDSQFNHKSYLYNNPPSALASEFSSSNWVNRTYPQGGAAALTSQSCSDGDRIVVEMGCKAFGTTGARIFDFIVGDLNATDLPEDETTTSNTTTPWIEFSQDLTFLDSTEQLFSVEELEALGEIIDSRGSQAPTVGQIWPRGF